MPPAESSPPKIDASQAAEQVAEQAAEQAADRAAELADDLDAPTIAPTGAAETEMSTDLPTASTSFDDYEIVDEIARGAMGVVYRAKQKSIGRLVAIKMVLDNGADLDHSFQRFENEARAAGNLKHPHIVSVFEVGRWRGLPYFVMEHVDGISLAEILRDDPLPPRRVAEIAGQVASAIEHAHDQRVVHRDLKPANILIDQDGNAHVTDFGVSKIMEGHSELTTIGELIGTPHYMPPEQAGGESEKMGPACDIYSIGAVMFAMLTGRPPFVAPTPIDVISQVLTQEPVSTLALNALVPTELDVITHQCLQKSPGDRYPSASELAADLQAYLSGEPIKARPPGFVQRLRLFFRRHVLFASVSGTAAMALVAMTMFSSFALLRSRNELFQLRFENEQMNQSLEITKQMRSTERKIFQNLHSQGRSEEDQFAQFEVQRLATSSELYRDSRPGLAVMLAVAAIQMAEQSQIATPPSAIDFLRQVVQEAQTVDETDAATQADLPTEPADGSASPAKQLSSDELVSLTNAELIEHALSLYPSEASSLDRELFGLPPLSTAAKDDSTESQDSHSNDSMLGNAP